MPDLSTPVTSRCCHKFRKALSVDPSPTRIMKFLKEAVFEMLELGFCKVS
jgi:hypothetical protein